MIRQVSLLSEKKKKTIPAPGLLLAIPVSLILLFRHFLYVPPWQILVFAECPRAVLKNLQGTLAAQNSTLCRNKGLATLNPFFAWPLVAVQIAGNMPVDSFRSMPALLKG